MKMIISIWILLFELTISYSQDTIKYIKPGCLHNQFKSEIIQNGSPIKIHFTYSNDTLTIEGEIGANCLSSHIAIVNKKADTIYITTLDTGQMATCSCVFNFEFKIRSLLTDTILKFNGIKFNTKDLNIGIKTMIINDKLIEIHPNPIKDRLNILIYSRTVINKILISDLSGHIVKTIRNEQSSIDLTDLRPGVYIIDFIIDGGRRYKKKIEKL